MLHKCISMVANSVFRTYYKPISRPSLEHEKQWQASEWIAGNPVSSSLRRVLTPFLAALVCAAISLSAATLYVSPASPNPSPPFNSWATAARNIQQAVDAATAKDEIVVANGVYATGGRSMDGTITNCVAVDKALTLRSVNGPQFTIIQGGGVGGSTRCAYLADGASLSGFTLTNGAASPQNGGGAWCASTNAHLTNCVIVGNTAWVAGGASGGALYNCALTGNQAIFWDGGGASESILYNCTLSTNRARFGGGALSSTLYDCALAGNHRYRRRRGEFKYALRLHPNREFGWGRWRRWCG